MPIRVGTKGKWQIVTPTAKSVQTLAISVPPDQFEVATDLYYVNVARQ